MTSKAGRVTDVVNDVAVDRAVEKVSDIDVCKDPDVEPVGNSDDVEVNGVDVVCADAVVEEGDVVAVACVDVDVSDAVLDWDVELDVEDMLVVEDDAEDVDDTVVNVDEVSVVDVVTIVDDDPVDKFVVDVCDPEVDADVEVGDVYVEVSSVVGLADDVITCDEVADSNVD